MLGPNWAHWLVWKDKGMEIRNDKNLKNVDLSRVPNAELQAHQVIVSPVERRHEMMDVNK